MKSFSTYNQADNLDCGQTCIRIIAKYYIRKLNSEILRRLSGTNRVGSSLKNIAICSENVGFRSLAVKISTIEFHWLSVKSDG